MVNLYAIFHANLNFSLIEESEYPKVIERCYWPLLGILARNKKLKIGLEFSGNTLLKLKSLDPSFIKKLKSLIKQKRIEIIASGLEQIISPLVPYQVTLDNLALGKKVYKQILGINPEIVFLNEQTFSDGVIDLYKETGYKAVVLDWDNLPQESKKTTTPYQPAILKSQNGTEIKGIFISSVAMQNFRKLIFNEISKDQYLRFLKQSLKKNSIVNFPIYGDDLEIYDFKPNSLNFENKTKDFVSIEKIIKELIKLKHTFILPSGLLKTKTDVSISLTDTNATIRTKKQEKYNVTRWAVCGRSNSKINTLCFRIHKNLKKIRQLAEKKINKSKHNELNRELITLFASDFRTHTSEGKWLNFQKRLGWLLKETQNLLKENTSYDQELPLFNNKNFTKIDALKTNSVHIKFWTQKGGVIESLIFPKISKKPLCGSLIQGYYQTPKLQADWFTGHSIIRLKDNTALTDLEKTELLAPKDLKKYKEKIPVYGVSKIGAGEVIKIYYVYVDKPRVDIEKYFMFYRLEPLSFRNFNLTLLPDSFDLDSMYLATVNGGKHKETFKLKDSLINQDEAVNLKVSSHGCQGATEGWITVGDKEKAITVSTDLSESYSVPLIHFEEVEDTFFARISTTVAESDETSSHFYRGKFVFKTTIAGSTKVH